MLIMMLMTIIMLLFVVLLLLPTWALMSAKAELLRPLLLLLLLLQASQLMLTLAAVSHFSPHQLILAVTAPTLSLDSASALRWDNDDEAFGCPGLSYRDANVCALIDLSVMKLMRLTSISKNENVSLFLASANSFDLQYVYTLAGRVYSAFIIMHLHLPFLC